MENKIIRNEASITFACKNKKIYNKEFALVDIRLCYAGRNRNMTDLPKDVLNTAVKNSLAGVPIVGEYIYDNSEETSGHFGGHGGKIVVSDNGIKFEVTTKPYGFIPQESAENAEWVEVIEKTGEVREYLTVHNAIVWLGRYPELNDILDSKHGQSFEISMDGYSDKDGYFVATTINFSACCILGDCAPCFESASIGAIRDYSLDSFKQEMKYMLDEYNKNSKKEENKMDCSVIKSKLAESTFKNELGEEIAKYSLISVNDTSIGVFDREDCNAYLFDCVELNGDIVIDAESKKLGTYSVVTCAEKDDIAFSMADEVNAIKSACQTKVNAEKNTAVDNACKAFAEEYDAKINQMGEAYSQLKADYDSMKVEYEKFKEADESRKIAQHKAEVDEIIENYSKKIGRNSRFLIYRAKIDYSKSVEEINKELTIIAGEAMMDKGTTKQFSYEPTVAKCTIDRTTEKYSTEDRYGSLLDKFKK